jgi:hypothetical protein
MKLSEGIRKGTELAKEAGIKQGKGLAFDFDADGKVCEACALGFAVLGKEGLDHDRDFYDKFNMSYSKILKLFGLTQNIAPESLQEKCDDEDTIDWIVVELNDRQNKSPMEIAEILEESGL